MPTMRFHPDSTEPVTKDENWVSQKFEMPNIENRQ
jgi:hypothetical protein